MDNLISFVLNLNISIKRFEVRKSGKNESNASESIPLAQRMVDALGPSSAENATPDCKEDHGFDLSIFDEAADQVDSTALMEKINCGDFDKALELISNNNARFSDADNFRKIIPFLKWLLANKNVAGLQQSIAANALTNRFEVLNDLDIEKIFKAAIGKYMSSQEKQQQEGALKLVQLYYQFYKSDLKNACLILAGFSGSKLADLARLSELVKSIFGNSKINAEMDKIISKSIATLMESFEYGDIVTLLGFLKQYPHYLNKTFRKSFRDPSFYYEYHSISVNVTILTHLLLKALSCNKQTSDCILSWYESMVADATTISQLHAYSFDKVVCDLLYYLQRLDRVGNLSCETWVKVIAPALPHLSTKAIEKIHSFKKKNLTLLQVLIRFPMKNKNQKNLTVAPLIRTVLHCIENDGMSQEKRHAWKALLTKEGDCRLYYNDVLRFPWQEAMAMRDFESASLLLDQYPATFTNDDVVKALDEYVAHTRYLIPKKAFQGKNPMKQWEVFDKHIMPLIDGMLTRLSKNKDQARIFCMALIERAWTFDDRSYAEEGKTVSFNFVALLLNKPEKFNDVCHYLNKNNEQEATYLSNWLLSNYRYSVTSSASSVHEILMFRKYPAELCFDQVSRLVSNNEESWQFKARLFYLVCNSFTLAEESGELRQKVEKLWKQMLHLTLDRVSQASNHELLWFWGEYKKNKNKAYLELNRNEKGEILEKVAQKSENLNECLNAMLNHLSDWLGLDNSLSLRYVFSVIINAKLETEQQLTLIKRHCIKNRGKFIDAVGLYYNDQQDQKNDTLATKYFKLFVQAVIKEDYLIAGAMAKAGFFSPYTIDSNIKPLRISSLQGREPTTLLQFVGNAKIIGAIALLVKFGAKADFRLKGSTQSARKMARASGSSAALRALNNGKGAWTLNEFCKQIVGLYIQNRENNQSGTVPFLKFFRKAALAGLDKVHQNGPVAEIKALAKNDDLSGICRWLMQRAESSGANAKPNGIVKLSASQKTMEQLRQAYNGRTFEGRSLSQEIMDQLTGELAEAVPTVSYA